MLALQVSGSDTGASVVLKLDLTAGRFGVAQHLFAIEPQGDQRCWGAWRRLWSWGRASRGAIELAWRGWSTERILDHYYLEGLSRPRAAGVPLESCPHEWLHGVHPWIW